MADPKLLDDVSISNNGEWNESYNLQGFDTSELSKVRAYMQVRPYAGSLSIYLDLSSPTHGIVIEPLNKILKIYVPKTQVERIPPGNYVRDLVLSYNKDDVIFAGFSKVVITEGVTKLPERREWPE